MSSNALDAVIYTLCGIALVALLDWKVAGHEHMLWFGIGLACASFSLAVIASIEGGRE